jgi:hypothetical protein
MQKHTDTGLRALALQAMLHARLPTAAGRYMSLWHVPHLQSVTANKILPLKNSEALVAYEWCYSLLSTQQFAPVRIYQGHWTSLQLGEQSKSPLR